MNERIKEIHRQVMLWSDTPDCPDTVEWHPGQIPEEYTKKFAELLIRECIFAVEDAGGIDKYHYTKAISRHFGVEE